MSRWILITLIGFLLLITGCKKDDDETITPVTPYVPQLSLKVRFQVDGKALQFDTIKYMNAAQNNYSVSTLMFYLSRVNLLKADSSVVPVKTWWYIDAKNLSTCDVIINQIPEGNYIGMTFNIGLDSVQNIINGLPPTYENMLMEWPVFMGGGYHFMKMEGAFIDSTLTPGYAMHLGTNNTLCPVTLSGNICVGKNCNPVTLTMNVNEWFTDPNTYDFNIDGNYIMGDTGAMKKFAENGYNVFTIQQ
jgi:hypothetical protein